MWVPPGEYDVVAVVARPADLPPAGTTGRLTVVKAPVVLVYDGPAAPEYGWPEVARFQVRHAGTGQLSAVSTLRLTTYRPSSPDTGVTETVAPLRTTVSAHFLSPVGERDQTTWIDVRHRMATMNGSGLFYAVPGPHRVVVTTPWGTEVTGTTDASGRAVLRVVGEDVTPGRNDVTVAIATDGVLVLAPAPPTAHLRVDRDTTRLEPLTRMLLTGTDRYKTGRT